MFDWDRFKNGKIAVHCDTEEKANDFLKECNKQGITWTDGDKTTEINCWFWHEKNTSYACSCGKSKLVFDFLEYHKDKGLEIIKWEIDKMKELTFKEVIANIKEGQIWESDIKIIKCSINGNITVRSKIDNNSQIMNFNKDNLYKLKREEYTFQEAFKAYEEGKEIENIVTKYKFKKSNDGMIKITQRSGNITLTNESSVFVTIDEIRGKWYIND
ncbi:hypothetical protein [Clostridium tertium]|uniref:hypothetical protein n=1 Tax=Clostridium tertium TaxID=1559 RepID=UPI001C1E548A|nr:hypothetical protein [Clostridium tertium]MBU6137322.1 hypothetical protein [Clostridium tertium]